MKLLFESWRRFIKEEYKVGGTIVGYHATNSKPDLSQLMGFKLIDPKTPQVAATGDGFFMFRDKQDALNRNIYPDPTGFMAMYEPYEKSYHGYPIIITLEVPYDTDLLDVDAEIASPIIYKFVSDNIETFMRLEYEGEILFDRVERTEDALILHYGSKFVAIYKQMGEGSARSARAVYNILANMEVGNLGKVGQSLHADLEGELIAKARAFIYNGPPIVPTKIEVKLDNGELIDVTPEVLSGDEIAMRQKLENVS